MAAISAAILSVLAMSKSPTTTAAAISIRIAWGEVLAATFIPHVSWDQDFMLTLVAILGTTISAYMFFWQASLEVEERKLRAAAVTRKRLPQRDAANGVVAVPLMAGMMPVVGDRTIMGAFAASRLLMTFGWAATALMTIVVAAMLIANIGK